MVNTHRGLPLAIIVLGGILATKKDYQILAERLIQLWVAEGIVSSTEDEANGEVMEDVAEAFLDELVERSKQEKFLSIINDSSLSSSNTKAVHIIAVHRHIYVQRIKSSIPFRSILFFWHPFDLNLEPCLSDEDDFCFLVSFVCVMLKWKRSWKYMFGKFKKLRVLSFEGGEGYSRFKLSSAI
ncbi:hypothetical protein Goshw_000720, partial [Gossypium schwendimanii]|nr:hypothetical protein [Gossypium schwendimanii]